MAGSEYAAQGPGPCQAARRSSLRPQWSKLQLHEKLNLMLCCPSLLHSTLAQTIATNLHTEDAPVTPQYPRFGRKSPDTPHLRYAETRSPQKELTSPLPLPHSCSLARATVCTPRTPHYLSSLRAFCTRMLDVCGRRWLGLALLVADVASCGEIRGSFRRCRMVMRLPVLCAVLTCEIDVDGG